MAKVPTLTLTNGAKVIFLEHRANYDALTAAANNAARYVGAYSSSTNYNLNEWVSYGGSQYIAIQDGFTNKQPDTNPTFWTAFSGPAAIGNANGDVTGAYSALTVAKIRGVNVVATAPTAGQALVFDGTSLVPTSVLAASLVTTKGDLLVATAAGTIVRLPVGADGQRLVADSTTTAGVRWATPPIPALVIVTVTATSTIAATTDVEQTNTSSAVTITLPATVTNSRGIVTVKCVYFTGTPGTTTITPNTGQTIEGGVNKTLTTAGNSIDFYLDGTVWRLI